MKNFQRYFVFWAATSLVGLPIPCVALEENSQGADIKVFDEFTSFEDLIKNRQEIERNPAAFEPLARVIALRREIGMSNDTALKAPHDIILNGGTNSGFAPGMILSVTRKVPILDPYRENAQSELEIEFAKVKIIHVQKEVSVARLEEIESLEKGMFLGTRGILVGDFVSRSTK